MLGDRPSMDSVSKKMMMQWCVEMKSCPSVDEEKILATELLDLAETARLDNNH